MMNVKKSLFGAALMAATFAGLSTASANMYFDVQVTGVTGGTLTDAHDAVVANGSVVSYTVYATVTGTANLGFLSGEGRLVSVAGTGGSAATSVLGDFAQGTRSSPYDGTGSNAGTLQTSTGVGTTSLGAWIGMPTLTDGTAGLIVVRNPAATASINATTYSVAVYSGTYTVSNVQTGKATNLAFQTAATALANKNPSWFESSAAKTASNGTLGANIPAVLTAQTGPTDTNEFVQSAGTQGESLTTTVDMQATGNHLNPLYTPEITNLASTTKGKIQINNAGTDKAFLLVWSDLTLAQLDVINSGFVAPDQWSGFYTGVTAALPLTGSSSYTLAYDLLGTTAPTGGHITGIAVVPEPASLGLLTLGALGLLGKRRSK